jgi:hypothetical protein
VHSSIIIQTMAASNAQSLPSITAKQQFADIIER